MRPSKAPAATGQTWEASIAVGVQMALVQPDRGKARRSCPGLLQRSLGARPYARERLVITFQMMAAIATTRKMCMALPRKSSTSPASQITSSTAITNHKIPAIARCLLFLRSKVSAAGEVPRGKLCGHCHRVGKVAGV